MSRIKKEALLLLVFLSDQAQLYWLPSVIDCRQPAIVRGTTGFPGVAKPHQVAGKPHFMSLLEILIKNTNGKKERWRRNEWPVYAGENSVCMKVCVWICVKQCVWAPTDSATPHMEACAILSCFHLFCNVSDSQNLHVHWEFHILTHLTYQLQKQLPYQFT